MSRGNLVLRHSVPIKTLPFRYSRQILAAVEAGLTVALTRLRERRNENIKYFTPPSRNRTHNLSLWALVYLLIGIFELELN